MDHKCMMYQIRLQFYGTWQMTTWQRGGGPRLTDHPVIGLADHKIYEMTPNPFRYFACAEFRDLDWWSAYI